MSKQAVNGKAHRTGHRAGARSVTMRDVARLAQVSQSTVSRVVSGLSAPTAVPISEETIRRVQAAVLELGYQPNLAARSLRGQKTQLIAVMIADISNAYYHIMVRKIQDVARQHGYDVLIFNSDHSADEEHHFLQGLIRRPVDGVILTPYHLTREEIDQFSQRTNAEVVLLGQHIPHAMFDHVFADDYQSTYEAVRWLIQERHHKRIAYIGVPGTHPGERRVSAFHKAMQESQLPVPPAYLPSGDFTIERGNTAMHELMQLPERPTAVVACNDLMALGCLMAAESLGLHVPSDVAVLGFDDIPEASRVCPKLTTLAQPSAAMGETLARALFERMDGKVVGAGRSFELPCNLVIRDSA